MKRFQLQSVRRVGRVLFLVPMIGIAQSCTELTEIPNDALTPETAFKTEAELLAGVAGVYAQMRANEWVGYITLQDITTDVSIVPTRGSDWYDNGQWLDLHRQTFTPNSAGTLAFLNGGWNDPFSGVAKANLMIDVVTKAAPATGPRTLAELRTLRAWYYYMLQDMFGGVPLVTEFEIAPQQVARSTRAQIFQFIESELIAAIPDLPASWPSDGYGRVTKSVANAILASLYINAGVFGRDAGVNANGYNSCMAVNVAGPKTGCQGAIDAANAVINSGLFSLNPDWSKNFSGDNNTSPENIFVLVYTNQRDLGGNWPMRTLHYNQLSTGDGGPWNGFATLAETYNQFESTDVRRGMWLAGQAFSFQNNAPVNDRTGNPLIFTASIPDANTANEANGVRFNKFAPLANAPSGGAQPNDFTFFRLAEMHLIKAEALNEQGNLALAVAELNTVHNLRNTNPIPAGSLTTQAGVRTAILRERLLEFAGEGKRRSDLIRHGRFLERWSTVMLNGKQDRTADVHKILFPIPVTQLGSNPLLTQNPGY